MREDARLRMSTRERLYIKQNCQCAYCRRVIRYKDASLDHIIPVVKLEANIGPANLVMCCKRCNINKGDMIVFTNLFDKLIYPIQVVPVIYQDYYIHSTKKIRKSY